MNTFEGKVAVITGAASGIGAAIAARCIAEGMKVVLADVDEPALAETAQSVQALGAQVLPVLCDVSREDHLHALAERTLQAFGAVHVLFNNAGVSAGSLLWESSVEDWQWVLGVNLWGLIHATRIFVPLMFGQNTECHIVNTASIAGLIANPGNGIYGVSKHAIVSFSETLYQELKLAQSQIDVSVVCPGFVRTQLMDSDRNRPAALRNAVDDMPLPPHRQMNEQLVREGIRNGLPPEQVASAIFEAIRAKRFYVFTHDDTKDMIRQRMENLVNGANPRPIFG